eukprot:940077-Alexandrium_andersonii.AAC.1
MSPLKIQAIAEAAVKDGASHGDLKRLATLGGSGTNPQNCQRDLLRSLVPSGISEAISEVQLAFKTAFNT